MPGSQVFKEAFTYNHAGNIVTRAYPDGTTGNTDEVITYDYDTVSGLPETLEGDGTYTNDDYVTSTTWNPVGQITAQQAGDGDGLYWDPAYDVHTRLERSLVRQGTSTGTISQDYNYDRDDTSLITRIWDDTVVNDQFQCFTYDDLGRMTTGFTGDYLCRWYRSNGPDPYYYAYEYDEIGNLTKKGGVTLDYSGVNAGPHAVTKYGTDDYAYDDNGNMTSRDIPSDTQTLTWDENHQLASVADTSVTTSFLYDADGNRVKTTTGSESTVYVGGGVYEYQTAGANTTETSYYTLGGRSVAVRNDSDLHYLAQDHLGSTSLTRDESSGSVAVHRYSPYGAPRGSSAPTETDHTYTGQIADAATDLMFYNARYYDPGIGRFISPDSIIPNAADPQDLNRYAYVRNNPVNFVDPSGQLPSERTAITFERNRRIDRTNAWYPVQEPAGRYVGVISGEDLTSEFFSALGLLQYSAEEIEWQNIQFEPLYVARKVLGTDGVIRWELTRDLSPTVVPIGDVNSMVVFSNDIGFLGHVEPGALLKSLQAAGIVGDSIEVIFLVLDAQAILRGQGPLATADFVARKGLAWAAAAGAAAKGYRTCGVASRESCAE